MVLRWVIYSYLYFFLDGIFLTDMMNAECIPCTHHMAQKTRLRFASSDEPNKNTASFKFVQLRNLYKKTYFWISQLCNRHRFVNQHDSNKNMSSLRNAL
jgi:hypothetical protein